MAEKTFQVVLVGLVALLHVLALAALLRGAGTRRHKIVWTTVLVLVPVVGVVLYILWGHGPRDAHLPP